MKVTRKKFRILLIINLIISLIALVDGSIGNERYKLDGIAQETIPFEDKLLFFGLAIIFMLSGFGGIILWVIGWIGLFGYKAWARWIYGIAVLLTVIIVPLLGALYVALSMEYLPTDITVGRSNLEIAVESISSLCSGLVVGLTFAGRFEELFGDKRSSSA